jgi:hypothetical protein
MDDRIEVAIAPADILKRPTQSFADIGNRNLIVGRNIIADVNLLGVEPPIL